MSLCRVICISNIPCFKIKHVTYIMHLCDFYTKNCSKGAPISHKKCQNCSLNMNQIKFRYVEAMQIELTVEMYLSAFVRFVSKTTSIYPLILE